jgi:tape measure domain-containing protein
MADKEVNLKINADTAESRKNVGQLDDSLEALGTTLGGEVAPQAEKAAEKLADLGKVESDVTDELKRKGEAIKATLALEQSQLDLATRHLQLQRQEQQGILEAARARGDESAAIRAQSALRDIEVGQLKNVAQAKRAEATAIAQAAQASRDELSARGPLTKAQSDVIAASENHAKALRVEAAAADTAAGQMQAYGRSAGSAAGDLEQLGKVGDGLKSKLAGVAAAVGGLFAAAQIKDYALSAIETADAYGQMAERIKMATPAAADYAVVQKRILDAANLTYRPLKEQQTLYIETADALRELGYSTQQALDIQDSFTYLLTTNAASQEHGKNAIDAYTKSINSGRIEVDAWQSLMAATPTIIDAVAAATGKTTGEVRQLGITGKLSIADLNEGLRLSVERNKQLASGMSTTVKDAVQRLANTWQTYIGEANQASQSTSKIVKLVDMLSNNLDTVIRVATAAGEVMVAVWAVKGVAALGAYIAQLRLAIAETERLAAVSTTAGATASAALAKAGYLAAAAWAGWEIGTLLRDKFEVVQKAGILMSEILTKSAARVQGAWEMVQAAFTSDTIEAASARMQQRLKEIDEIYGDMYASIGQAAQAQNAMAASTNASGTAAENAKVKWEQYKSSFTAVSEQLTLHKQQLDSLVALRNAEAEGIAYVAREMGTEKEARQAAADAAAVQAEQAKVLARQAGFELEAVRSHRDALVALGAEVLKNDPIRQKELAALNAEVKARESAAGQAIAHARSLEVAAISAKAEVSALEDNSSKVKELGQAYEKTRGNLELMRSQQALGIKTIEEVRAAENELVKSARAYKDALADQEKMIRSRASAEQAGLDVKASAVNLAIEQQRSILAVAKATGDEALAIQAENRIRQLQIELLQLTAKAKDAEAKSALALIEVKRAELIASGQLTEAKRLELDAATKAAQVKQMEAKIARETADGLQRLGQVRQGSKSDIDAEADALRRLNGERERELDNMVKRDNMGHETRTAGTSTGTRQGIIEWLKGAGLDEALAEYVSKDFVDANGNVAYMDNGGQKKWRGNSMDHALSNVVDYYKYGQGKEEAEAMAAEAAKQKEAKEAKTAAKAAPAASPAPAPASSGGSGATYVSHITLSNGEKKTVKFADASSQSTTEQLLRDLANARGVY